MGTESGRHKIQHDVNESFSRHFGRTPTAQRVSDIERQTSKLVQHVDLAALREGTGDLLCSVVQLANENQWDLETLVAESLKRIEGRREIYAALGRRLKVGVLGGAFDPIHRGHVEMSKNALASGMVDEVWWMPCYRHLAGKRMESPEHRLAMCEAAAKEVKGVRVSDFEIKHRFLGESYHLAKKLMLDEEIQSRCVLYLILGRDNADSMHAWSNFEGIRRLMPILVVPHGDAPPPPADAWYRQSPNRYIEQAHSAFTTSSTEIRRRLAAGDDSVSELLPEGVRQYIRQNGLYQPANRTAGAKSEIKVSASRSAVMIGSFDPPTSAQVELVESLLSRGYESVKLYPAAHIRAGMVIEHADSVHRAALIDLAFGGRPRVEIDFRGLEDERAVSPAALARALGSNHDLWFVVADDAVAGVSHRSDLRNDWQEGDRLWNEAGFIVVLDPEAPEPDGDLPPRYEVIRLANMRQPVEMRQKLAQGIDVSGYIPAIASRYIRRHRLFQSVRAQMQWPVCWDQPRIRLVYDTRNEKASRLAERYRRWEGSDPDFILVIGGDGTMLHAIREYWRLRLPFLGINAGHLGFLMNQKPFESLDGLEVVSYRMPMLHALVESASGELRSHDAFSDAWIERQTGQAAWFRLDLDGESCLPKVVGDGLLVATPSGSSSYARAMGATPVPLDTQSLTVAGSNIFRPRFWQPLMMPADAKIQITSIDETGKRPVQAFVDGVPAGPARSIRVSRSPVAAVELTFAKHSDLAAKLLASLLPSESDRY